MNKEKKVWKEIKYWFQLFLLPIYALSYFMPRDKHIWVLGSTFGSRFADNPKYFYLYLNQHCKKDIKAIWISKERGIVNFLKDSSYDSYYLYSLKGIWFSLRAKVYLYDNYSKDICFTLSGGAVKINLWHGIPLKKIQNDNIFDRVRNPRNLVEKLRWLLRRASDEKPTDYVLTTSEYLKPIFSSAFSTKNVIVSGYPRNDFIMFNCIETIINVEEKEIYNHIIEKKEKCKKIILYTPTFRESESGFFDVMAIVEFERFLKENHLIFYVKLHPKSKMYDCFLNIQSEYINVIKPSVDTYVLLKQADILVTDYSSIYFDFLLLGKPIIFFPYDLNQYLENSREMYFDYNEITPGIKVSNQAELEDALLMDRRESESMNKIKAMMFADTKTISSEVLYKKIIKILL